MASKRKKAARKQGTAAAAPEPPSAPPGPKHALRYVSDKVPTLALTVEDAIKQCVLVAREAMTTGVVNRERVPALVLALEIVDGNAKPAPPDAPHPTKGA